MKRYMKNRFEFIGLKTPLRRQLQRQFFSSRGIPSRNDLPRITQELFSYPYRELHYAATELATRILKHPAAADLHLIEFLLTNNQWWDTVDTVATGLAGKWMWFQPDRKLEVFNKWNESRDMWLNRTAILFQLKYKENTDLGLLETAITRHAASPEFFHRKAIGWALRQYARTDPEWVLEFVSTHDISPLSRRNALKHINPFEK